MFDLNSSKPIIIYPSKWTYAVIGPSEVALRLSIAEVMQGLAHEIKPSHQSGSGKYSSFHVEVVVQSEAHRNTLFQALKKHPAVKMVI